MSGPLFLAALAGTAWLVGHVAHATGVRQDSPAGLVSTTERAFAKLALGFLFVGWWGIVLAEAGWFGPVALLAGCGVVLAALALRAPSPRNLLEIRPGLDPGYSPALVVLLAAIAAWLYFPPFEVHLAARDPAVYQLAGVHIAEEGSWLVEDGTIAGLDDDVKSHLYPQGNRTEEGRVYPRYMGFYLADAREGTVVPQFLPLLPVWVAVGYLAGGAGGGMAAAPLLALLAAVALYYLGRRLSHPAVGAVAAVMLAGNFVQAWFARYSAAEMPAQALVLLGAYGLTVHRRHGDPFFAWLAAGSFGLCWFTKAEMGLLAPLFFALLVVDGLAGRIDRDALLHFWGPLTLLGIHTSLHAWGWSWPYVGDLLLVQGLSVGEIAVAGFLALSVVAALALWQRRGRPLEIRSWWLGTTWSARAARWGASGLLVGGAVYGFFWRPYLDPGLWNTHAVVELAWAVSPAVLVAAVGGAVLYLNDRHLAPGSRSAVLLLLPAAAYLVWFPNIIPDLMWAYRRSLPVTIPLALLLATQLAWRVSSSLTSRLADREDGGRASGGTGLPVSGSRRTSSGWERAGSALGPVLLLLLAGVHVLPLTRRYQGHQEMAGALEFVERVASATEPDALLIFEPRSRSGLTRLEAPLDFLEHRAVVRWGRRLVDGDQMLALVRQQAQRGRSSYLLTAGQGVAGYASPLPEAVATERLRFQLQLMEEVPWRLPRRPLHNVINVAIYRLLPASGRSTLAADGLDVGSWDELWVHRFHGVEVAAGSDRTFRWSRGDSGVWLPGLGAGAKGLVLVAAMSGPWVDEHGAREVEAWLDGVSLGTVRVRRGWRQYRLEIPAAWQPPAREPPYLRLETETWSPADHGDSSDARELGIMLDRVGWEPASAGTQAAPGRPVAGSAYHSGRAGARQQTSRHLAEPSTLRRGAGEGAVP